MPVNLGKGRSLSLLGLRRGTRNPRKLLTKAAKSNGDRFLRACVLSLTIRFRPRRITFLLVSCGNKKVTRPFGGVPRLLKAVAGVRKDGGFDSETLTSVGDRLGEQRELFSRCRIGRVGSCASLCGGGVTGRPLPRLFLVSSRFTRLGDRRPRFVERLIDTTQVKQDLKIRLVLTARGPNNIVSRRV